MPTDAQLMSDLKQRDPAGVRASEIVRVSDPALLSLAERVSLLEGGDARRRNTPRVRDLLAHAINRDVLPRMVLARRGQAATDPPAALVACQPSDDVEQLATIAMARGMPEALAFVEHKCAGGMATDAIYLDLMAPAARLLGRLWEDDMVDFGQVTIATNRLRQAMRSFGLAHQDAACQRQATHRVLLAPGPGDQHSFGLAMVADFFGRAGWHVWSGVPESSDQLLQMVRRDWYGVVGFSVGTVVRLDALSEVIRKIRRLSRNRAIALMVGGPVFHQHPELVAMVGADATASDGREAVLQAHRLLDLASR